MARVGLGCIVAFYCRSTTLYQIHYIFGASVFETTMRPNPRYELEVGEQCYREWLSAGGPDADPPDARVAAIIQAYVGDLGPGLPGVVKRPYRSP